MDQNTVVALSRGIIGRAARIDKIKYDSHNGIIENKKLMYYYFNGRINFEEPLSKKAQIYITDITGKTYNLPVHAGQKSFDLRSNSMNPGFYVLKIIDENKVFTGKVVVTN